MTRTLILVVLLVSKIPSSHATTTTAANNSTITATPTNFMTYDNSPRDLSEVATRHVKTKRRTRVPIDDLKLDEMDAAEAAQQVMARIGIKTQSRLTKLFEKATSLQCRAKIAEHYGYFVNAIGMEKSLPFYDVIFHNECPSPPAYDFNDSQPGRHLGMIQNKTYVPAPNATARVVYKFPNEYNFCYAIMTHQHPPETIRLIEALYEPGHSFIIHVDAKEASDETHAALHEYALSRSYIHVLNHPQRVRVNWGGFSMVNATLQMLHYSLEHQPSIDYDKFIHLASTNYPLASNAKIRQTIAHYPVDANLMHIVLKPSRPKPASWHYFVECDDAVHRIHRLPPLVNATAGAELYTSSQWFTLSREFARYLAYATTNPNTFVYEFLQYAQHVVVADETFFGTALLHSPFCDKHHNWNFVHLQFDQWENEIPLEKRDPKKCIMPDPAHCGRSPTTVSMDYVDLLTLTDDLFARKFNDETHPDVKDVLDEHRRVQQMQLEQLAATTTNNENAIGDNKDTSTTTTMDDVHHVNTTFEGHGILIVAKATVASDMPLCLGLGPKGNYARLVPCFYEEIVPSLETGWETGAIIVEETPFHNRWLMSSCTSDGNLKRQTNGDMEMTPGKYSPTGPRCMLTQVDGIRAGRCLDGHSNDIEPGGKARVFPCVKRWPQFLSFGNGILAPKGSMHTNVPRHIVDRITESRPDEPPQESYLCLGVLGRGDRDEEHLYEVEDEVGEDEVIVKEYDDDQFGADGLIKLDNFQGEEIVATRCSNVGAVVEWLFVPFIDEDGEEEDAPSERSEDAASTSDATNSDENQPQQPTCSTESCYEGDPTTTLATK